MVSVVTAGSCAEGGGGLIVEDGRWDCFVLATLVLAMTGWAIGTRGDVMGDGGTGFAYWKVLN